MSTFCPLSQGTISGVTQIVIGTGTCLRRFLVQGSKHEKRAGEILCVF